MVRLLGWALLAMLGLFAVHRYNALDSMGERRAERLARPGKEVVVGVSWPFAENHDGFDDGVRLAQQEINGEGGVQLRLVLRNSGGDWPGARAVALAFARDADMSAVIGYHYDSQAVRASALYENSRLLHLVAGSTSTALTDHGNPYIVHTLVSADKVARSLAQAGAGQRYALVWEKDGEWDSLVAGYRVAQDGRGASVAYQRAYSRGREDFQRVVNQLKTTAADVILFAGDESAAIDFLGRANAGGLSQPIICACLATPRLKALAGASRGNTMLLDFYDEGSASKANQAFVARYRARYGRPPDTWAAQGYDALKLLAEALRATASRRSEDLALALRYMPAWEGANGSYKFDETGRMEDKPVFIKRYRDGAVVDVITAQSVADDVPRPTPAPVAVPTPR